MDRIKDKFAERALPLAEEIKQLIKEHGNHVLGQYTVEQVYQGMKSMIALASSSVGKSPVKSR